MKILKIGYPEPQFNYRNDPHLEMLVKNARARRYKKPVLLLCMNNNGMNMVFSEDTYYWAYAFTQENYVILRADNDIPSLVRRSRFTRVCL